jgi:hypothetical protein
MKRKEQIEQITVFRNENGSPVGMIIAEDESPVPVYGAFAYTLPNDWRWVIESTDKEKVLRKAREVFSITLTFARYANSTSVVTFTTNAKIRRQI